MFLTESPRNLRAASMAAGPALPATSFAKSDSVLAERV